MSRPATGAENEAADLLDNCDGDYEDALRFLEKMRSHILDRAHAVEGFEKYKELKSEDNSTKPTEGDIE